MHEISYGVHSDGVTVGEDQLASPTVKLGDGKTLIASVVFKNSAGIVFTESDGDPFESWEGGEKAYLVNDAPYKEKIYVVFTCQKSIDAAIAQLLVAKNLLAKIKQD
jgi:hypothetical protein